MEMQINEERHGLIRGFRDRLERTKSNLQRRGETAMAEVVKRRDFQMTPWDPLRAMRELLRFNSRWTPVFDVRENGATIRFFADLPAVRKDDLEVSVTGNRLVVSGHRDAEERAKDEQVHAYERKFGPFTRSFLLPDYADLDHITSDLHEGVLTIAVPKTGSAKSRKITVGSVSTKS